MLGVQNNLPVNNQVKFGNSFDDDYGYYEDIPEQLPDSVELKINKERDAKLAEIDETKQEFDKLADNLEKNPNRLSQKLGKAVRVGSMIAGLAGTFIMAKYGSKVSINAFKSFGKSEAVQKILKGGKDLLGKTKKPMTGVSEMVSKNVSKPISDYLKGSALGKKAMNIVEKPMVKNVLEKVSGYKEAGKTLLKSINGDKIQSFTENTLAASATASVLIDDLAGRNDNKSNLDVALGVSGGDR